ncbi:MAG: hypothetical protein J5727_08715 [Kiritimatiellae bacterium]|nr:hypothetical protein [Kiritimatiellia bacterium]
MKTTTIRQIVMSALVFAFALCAGEALAADVHVWTGEGRDNKWTTAENWLEASPDPRYVSFPAGQDWTVEIAANTNNWLFSLELPEGSGTVTLTGHGLLMAGSGSVVKIGAGRELRIDGPTVDISLADTFEAGFVNGALRVVSGEVNTAGLPNIATFGGDACLIVEGGVFGREDGDLCLTNNATLTVLGGVVQAKRWNICSPDAPLESITRVLLKGGTFRNCDQYTYMTKLCEGARFENIGGTLVWGQGTDLRYNVLSSAVEYGQGASFREFLPLADGKLVIPTSTTHANGALYFAVEGDYTVGGAIFATNNVDVAAGNVNFYGTNVVLRGRPTVYANAVNVSRGGNCDYDLYLSRLNLGIGGIRRTAQNEGWQSLNFKEGIVFGAWGGNVPADESERLSVNFEGTVVYDTLDCFDKATARTINMSRIKMDGVTDFKATGGGTVLLSVAALADELRTVEVEGNTTLAFTGAKAGIKTMNLKLGANAKLMVDISASSYIDASATAEFGNEAKVVVTNFPASPVSGKFYPVYFAPAGTVPNLSNFESASPLPSGWSFAKAGNAVYLTDGSCTETGSMDIAGTYSVWSGAGSDNKYSTTGNWEGGTVARTSCVAFFKGNANTVVDIDEELTVRMFDVAVGPFMFSGSGITFQYPTESSLGDYSVASVRNDGAFSVVVADLVGTVTETNCLLFQSFGEGSISMTGGSNGARPLGFGGDVRLGGTWNVTSLRGIPEHGSVRMLRNSRLTVMPGATLAVAAQTDDMNFMGAGSLAVATNATAAIGGMDFTFTVENRHYVDGTLSVTCPLVPTARQTFLGDGTLALSGGIADAPNGGVSLEGNLTFAPADLTNDVAISVKGNVTVAPPADWTFGGDAALSLDDRSTLTLATGGHKLTLEKPIVSDGSLVVSGDGTVVLASAMSLGKVVMTDGAVLAVSKDFAAPGRYADVLSVREDDASISFARNFAVKKRLDATTGCTVYSVKNTKMGFSLVLR